jgi:hypothetical protein
MKQKPPHHPPSRFLVLDLAIHAIEVLRPTVVRIRRYDRDLGEQIRTSLSSTALNIAGATAAKAVIVSLVSRLRGHSFVVLGAMSPVRRASRSLCCSGLVTFLAWHAAGDSPGH